jgi:asparaginyl-tRNA synthetase
MDLVNVRDIFKKRDEYADKIVTIGGWVRSNRNSKNFGFIVVNDGTFFDPGRIRERSFQL